MPRCVERLSQIGAERKNSTFELHMHIARAVATHSQHVVHAITGDRLASHEGSSTHDQFACCVDVMAVKVIQAALQAQEEFSCIMEHEVTSQQGFGLSQRKPSLVCKDPHLHT